MAADKKCYVYSTLTSSVAYTIWANSQGDRGLATAQKQIVINGGSGVMDSKVVHTPHGVATTVTEDELVLLEENSVFQLHVTNGFITTAKKDIKVDVAVKSMRNKDASSPLNPKDITAMKLKEANSERV